MFVRAFFACLLFCACLAGAADTPAAGQSTDAKPASSPDPVSLSLKVGETTREGILFAPKAAKESPTPVVFVFHGHGGTARHAARTMGFHRLWSEAIVVYLQGLKTPGAITDPEGKRTGWQRIPGDQKDRDIEFFDAALAHLKKDYQVDSDRIYSTGHSNGGAFTYLLWEMRADVFAAFAPSASSAAQRIRDLPPKPVFHLAGEKDPLVKFAWQRLTIEAVRRNNDCEKDGTPWADKCTQFSSKRGAPLVTYIHPGEHEFPSEAPALIVRFFKEQRR
jgi:polyhydroxybutyrate depolymerase